MEPQRDTVGWRALRVAVVLAIYFYVAMEWLFVVTQPSFMAALTYGERLGVLLITPLPLVVPAVLLVGALQLVGTIAAGRVVGAVAWALPAAVLACSAFLLIDNFTYTIFRFGVSSTARGWQAVYVLLLLALFVQIYRTLVRGARRQLPALALLAGSLVLASTATAAWRYARATPGVRHEEGLPAQVTRRPNILILATDGLDAAEMSAYGYARSTTPFIDTLVPHALVCENALPNGTVTAASVVSILTGRLPTTTHVFSPKDILMGADAYQSLPAILRRLGYTTVALVPGVTDPFARNMQDAFDVANGRTMRGALQLPLLPDRVALALAAEVYFLQHGYERITSRLAHAVGLRRMVNAYREATVPSDVPDEERVRALLAFLASSSRPVFAYLHLMGTHEPFTPQHRVFSRDSTLRTDLFDDAVLDYDQDVGGVVAAVTRLGKLDDTIFVLTSDHGSSGSRHGRVPLVIVFPHGTPHGRIVENAQLLDVAPSLLDYLGAPIPSWMEGQSLLSSRPDRLRPIVTAYVRRDVPGGERMTVLAATVCDRVYELEFIHGDLTTRTLDGHTAGCRRDEVPTRPRARRLLVERLRASGHDLDTVTHDARALALVGAKLRGAHMASAHLAAQFLTGADLTDATLTAADLRGASLTGATLVGADLTGAALSGARLHDANLTRAHLAGANLLEARLPNAKLIEADLTHATFVRAVLTGADLTGANLAGADLSEARLNNTALTGARLSGATLVGTDLTGADLRDADCTGANLTQANLTNTNLAGTSLRGANLTKAYGMTPTQDGLATLDDAVTCPDGGPGTGDHSCVGRGGSTSPALGHRAP